MSDNSSENPIRVGVLLNSSSVQEWQLRALQALTGSDKIKFSIDLVVVNKKSHQSTFYSQLQSLIFEFSLYKMLIVYRKLYRITHDKPWYRRRTPIENIDIFSDAKTIECEPEPLDGLGNKLPKDAVNNLTDVDLGIRFGFGVLKGEALTAPKYGVLSYHHGDLTEYRGRPAGFYEYIHQRTTAGVTIQRLNETLDGGEIAVMSHINIHDAKSLREVRLRLFEEGIDLLPKAAYRCVYESDEVKPPDTIGDLYTTPTTREVISYLAERAGRIIR